MISFAHRLSDKVSAYIQLRQLLGYVFKKEGATLRAFCRFVQDGGHPGPLTQELALSFSLSRDVVPNYRAALYGIIVRFAEYLSVFDPRTERLDPQALPRCRATTPPRILSEGELGRLLTAAREGSRRHPLRSLTLQTIIGLLASTGLRSGEALRLDRSDVDLDAGVLQIRRTKFRKDRFVPLHPTACVALQGYARVRDRAFLQPASLAFFVNVRGRRILPSSLAVAFRQASLKAGLDEGVLPRLRPHDLRHRFAVTRIMTWHRDGLDVQCRLPLLATYLGHGRYSDTAYYVTATPELLGAAAARAFGPMDGES